MLKLPANETVSSVCVLELVLLGMEAVCAKGHELLAVPEAVGAGEAGGLAVHDDVAGHGHRARMQLLCNLPQALIGDGLEDGGALEGLGFPHGLCTDTLGHSFGGRPGLGRI